MDGSEANRTTTGDLPQPQALFKSQSQDFFGLTQVPRRALGDIELLGKIQADLTRSPPFFS